MTNVQKQNAKSYYHLAGAILIAFVRVKLCKAKSTYVAVKTHITIKCRRSFIHSEPRFKCAVPDVNVLICELIP